LPVKLIMTWDVAPGHDQDYFEFVVREFLPGVQRLGFELSDAWATAYGNRPQILIGAILPNRSKAEELLESPDWKSLNNKLQDYITNYAEKIVLARGGFQF
jgi:hypothetical protein